MTWVRRILVALPFAAPVTLTVLIIFADRLTCVSNVLPDSGSCLLRRGLGSWTAIGSQVLRADGHSR